MDASYLALMEELALLPARPLRITIDCLKFENFANSEASFAEFLKEEIHLWAKVLGNRTIGSLFVFHPYHKLAPFEFTRVLHMLASKFHIPEKPDKSFAVISKTGDINAKQLALSKGLGFSNFQIVLEPNQLHNLDPLLKKVRLLRDYCVNTVGIQLQHPDCLSEIRDSIKRIEAECKPDYICLGNRPENFNIVSDIGTPFSEELQNDDIDVIELGPEGSSTIGDIRVQNYCSSEKYQRSLLDKRLPVLAISPGKI